MPPPRPANYPFDVSPRFTTAAQQQIGQGIVPVGSVVGVIHDPRGDINNWVSFIGIRDAHRQIYTATAYADLIDLNVAAIKEKTEQIEARLASLQQTCDAQAGLLQQLVGMFGVVIPAWLTRDEVEHGDDMGLVRPSAEELELTVVFVILQNTPGVSDGDVVWITPPAGTLVVRGSTVEVGVNSVGL